MLGPLLMNLGNVAGVLLVVLVMAPVWYLLGWRLLRWYRGYWSTLTKG